MTSLMTMQAYATIERLCLKQEVCSQCHNTLEVVKDCIIMNECGHMMHEGCFRTLQENKQYSCRSCKGKINMIYILNQVQVVQILNDGYDVSSKRISEFETKIVDYFLQQFTKVEELQEQIVDRDLEIQTLKDHIKALELNSDNITLDYMNHKNDKYQQNNNFISHPSAQGLFSFKNLREQKKKKVEKQMSENEEDFEEISTKDDLNKTIIDIKEQKKNPFLTSIKEFQSDTKVSSKNNICSQSDDQMSEEKYYSQNTNEGNTQNFNQVGLQQYSNRSTMLDTYNISTNPFLEDQTQQNRNKDKLEFYSSLAGLSPQSNIFPSMSPYESKQGNNIFKQQNKIFSQNTSEQQNLIGLRNQLKSASYENSHEKQINKADQTHNEKNNWINDYSISQQSKQIDGLQFSFSNNNSIKSKSSNENINTQVPIRNKQAIYNLHDMKTIIFSEDQINQIKAFNEQTSQNSQITTNTNNNQNNNNKQQDAILSFSKSQNSNQNINVSNNLNRNYRQSYPQQIRYFKSIINQPSSDSKISERKQSQQKQQVDKFTFDSPFKSDQIECQEDENNKNTINTTILNNSQCVKSYSGGKLSNSRHREKCSSCSKHSHSNSDSKLLAESSIERKNKFVQEHQISSFQQARQRLKSKNEINENKNSANDFEAILKRDLEVIERQIEYDQIHSHQEKEKQQSKQSVTFNKKARRSHPDQNLLNYQNICLKMPKYAKN